MNCARRILGAPRKTSNDAILVRLGWLPLEYLMIFRCVILCIKAKRGMAGPSMQRLFTEVETYSTLKPRLSRFFRPALDTLNRLASYNTYGTNFDTDSIPCIKRTVRQCMYIELTSIWSRACVASVTRLIHPRWEKRDLPNSMHCRLAHVRYNCAALNRCPLRKRLFLIKRAKSDRCRYGCDEIEDLQHMLFVCPKVADEREAVVAECKSFGFALTLRNFFTRERLQKPVEKMILAFTDPV